MVTPPLLADRVEAALADFPRTSPSSVRCGWELGTHPAVAEARPTVSGTGPYAAALAPYLADALRRAGLVTTEPHRSALVFVSEPPADTGTSRFHSAPAPEAGHGVVDAFTGAWLRTGMEPADAEWRARGAQRKWDAARTHQITSHDLPGVATGQEDDAQARQLAVELLTGGHTPYGLPAHQADEEPGFLVMLVSRRREHARVYRLMDPWGACRPGARISATEEEVRRFDHDLAAYAARLSRPDRRVEHDAHHVAVEFLDRAGA